MKVIVDREIFHQMMRGIAGNFRPNTMSNVDHQRMKLVAERLAHATAIRKDSKVEVDVL